MTQDNAGQKRKPVRAIKPELSKPSCRELQRARYLAQWRAVDWTKQDVELAREMGLSRERIRQIRQLLGVPQSPHHGSYSAYRHRNALALQWAAENLDRLKGLSGEEVRRKYGFPRHFQVYEFLRAKGVLRNGNRIRKYRWSLMNFELPNGALQRIWKLPRYRATTYRSRKHLPAPKWSLAGGLGALQRRGELRAYHRAVKAEERKAARYFAQAEAAGHPEASEGCGGRIERRRR